VFTQALDILMFWFAYSNDAIAIVVGVYFSLTQMMS